MITIDQAINLPTFHAPVGDTGACKVYRRNGQTQTWKTRPNDFRVPTKFGMYRYVQITQDEAHLVYAPADCPACHGTKH